MAHRVILVHIDEGEDDLPPRYAVVDVIGERAEKILEYTLRDVRSLSRTSRGEMLARVANLTIKPQGVQ